VVFASLQGRGGNRDPAGNIKPDKERSSERIDGISALVNALGRALLRDGTDGRSVYETRGILFV
jgi:phage terminase large subunit-like protein